MNAIKSSTNKLEASYGSSNFGENDTNYKTQKNFFIKNINQEQNYNKENEEFSTFKKINTLNNSNNITATFYKKSKNEEIKSEEYNNNIINEKRKMKVLNMIKNAHIEKIRNFIYLKEINYAYEEIQRNIKQGNYDTAKEMERELNNLQNEVIKHNINKFTKNKLGKSHATFGQSYNSNYSSNKKNYDNYNSQRINIRNYEEGKYEDEEDKIKSNRKIKDKNKIKKNKDINNNQINDEINNNNKNNEYENNIPQNHDINNYNNNVLHYINPIPDDNNININPEDINKNQPINEEQKNNENNINYENNNENNNKENNKNEIYDSNNEDNNENNNENDLEDLNEQSPEEQIEINPELYDDNNNINPEISDNNNNIDNIDPNKNNIENNINNLSNNQNNENENKLDNIEPNIENEEINNNNDNNIISNSEQNPEYKSSMNPNEQNINNINNEPYQNPLYFIPSQTNQIKLESYEQIPLYQYKNNNNLNNQNPYQYSQNNNINNIPFNPDNEIPNNKYPNYEDNINNNINKDSNNYYPKPEKDINILKYNTKKNKKLNNKKLKRPKSSKAPLINKNKNRSKSGSRNRNNSPKILYAEPSRGRCFACDINCSISRSGNSPNKYVPYFGPLKKERKHITEYDVEKYGYYQYKSRIPENNF